MEIGSDKVQIMLPEERILNKIYYIRGYKVMLDKDLAELYEVETRALNQAVKRNLSRFPADFMFQLNADEFDQLISQTVMSRWGGTRKLPYAFTEQGVAMLSSVLSSERAVQVNIQIMRTFTRLRAMLVGHEELKRKLENMEKKYDERFCIVFQAIRRLLDEDAKPKKR